MTIAENSSLTRTASGDGAYGSVARALHWAVFALVLGQFIVAWTMPHIRRTTPQEGLVDWHLSIGAVLLVVVVFRLVWRISHPTPFAAAMARWERNLARAAHEALYALPLVIPVLGWAAAGYFGYTVRLFGVVPLPALADGTMEWAHQAGDLHGLLTSVLLGVIGLHLVGALYHYFVLRDRVLQRMLPGV